MYEYHTTYVCGTRVCASQLRRALTAAPYTEEREQALISLDRVTYKGSRYSGEGDDVITHCVTVACRAHRVNLPGLVQIFPR